ncbi:MAG: hypothetical protein ACTHK4_16220, partial [Mycobacteriales bacterium]
SVGGLATMLSLHPMFAPRSYIAARFTVEDDAVEIGIADCPALRENDAFSWVAGLGGDMDRSLDALVSAFDPYARCERTDPRPEEVHAYRVTVDPGRAPAAEVPELAIAKISTGAAFRFRVPTASR